MLVSKGIESSMMAICFRWCQMRVRSGLRLVGISSMGIVVWEVTAKVGRSVRIVGMIVGRELYAEEIAEEMKLRTLLWRQVYLP